MTINGLVGILIGYYPCAKNEETKSSYILEKRLIFR
jgi:hypothetical protein